MSEILVRNTTAYHVVQSTDPEAEEVIRRWFLEDHPEEDSSLVTIPEEVVEARAWLLHARGGELAIIHPVDFATDFEVVEGPASDMNGFEAMLEQTAKAEQTKNEQGMTPQQVIDNYIHEKVALMLDAFDDLSVEQEDNESMDALQAARDKFKEVFGIREDPE